MKRIYFLIVFVLLSFGEIVAQDNSSILAQAAAKSSADSSHIAVNKRGGWQSLVSHLTPMKQDSVLFELVLKHDRTIDLKQEQLVGRIKLKKLLPLLGQNLSFKLIRCVYQLRIEPDGRCYIRLQTGPQPAGESVIVPIRTMYKL